MDPAFSTAIPDPSLAAIGQLSENSRLGFPSRNPVLHRGIEWSKSTLALGLPEWSGKTASDHVVAANNSGERRLQVHSDCSRTGYRRIVYEVTGPNAGDWYVTEHVNPTTWAPPNGTSTDRAPGQFDDTIFGWQTGNALQSFTISRQNPTQYPGTPSIPIIVRLGGADYGTLGVWHGGTNGMQFVQGNSNGWASCIRE
jgi:hypothetical protein